MGLRESWGGGVGGRRVVWGVVGLVGIAVASFAYGWLQRPPQIGADDEVFKTVDALFTAVTARDGKRLGECKARLQAHRAAARLAEGPGEYLDGVIAEARGGGWEPAAERLYEFMLAQRRK